MNQYKIEMKEIFRKEILVCAESEKEATDIVEKAYLRTNMLDHSYKDLAAVETKVIGKREENNYLYAMTPLHVLPRTTVGDYSLP